MCHSNVSSYQHRNNAEHSQLTNNDSRLQRSGWLKQAKKVGFATPAGQIEPQDPMDGRLGDCLPYIVGEAHGATEVSDYDDKVNIRGCHDKRSGQTKTDLKNDEGVDPLRYINDDVAVETNLYRRSATDNVHLFDEGMTLKQDGKVIEDVSQGNHAYTQEHILDDNASRPSRQGPQPYQASVHLLTAMPSSPSRALKRSKTPELGSRGLIKRVRKLREVRETPDRSFFSDTRNVTRHTIVSNGGITTRQRSL